MRILIVSDIHGNLSALEAVLTAAGSVDAVWNLGDTVGYGPYPAECLDRMVDVGADVALLGNHDAAAVGMLSLEEFNPVARAATLWTARQLSDGQRALLQSLPPFSRIEPYLFVHGSPRHPIWEYVYSAAVAKACFAVFDDETCFLGHTHIQLFISEQMADAGEEPQLPRDGDAISLDDGRFIINPGSVGQPRDGNPDAAFALLELERQRVTFRRVPYDIEATQAAMRAAGLPTPLITRLSAGV